jgi:hypothetical protein
LGGGKRQERTYADVELDYTPEDKHGGVLVAKLDTIDLHVAEDGAQSCEEAEGKDAQEAELPFETNVELEQNRDGKESNNDVGNDGQNGVGCKRSGDGNAFAGGHGFPRLGYL